MPCLAHLRPRQDDHNLAYHFQIGFFFQTTKNHCNLFVRVHLIINENWFRQWLGTEQTLSHYLSQWGSRSMVHIRVSRIELINSSYWENLSMGRKTVLFEHTRDIFTPIAESGQFLVTDRWDTYVKLTPGDCHWTLLMTSQHGLGNGFGAVRQQASDIRITQL